MAQLAPTSARKEPTVRMDGRRPVVDTGCLYRFSYFVLSITLFWP